MTRHILVLLGCLGASFVMAACGAAPASTGNPAAGHPGIATASFEGSLEATSVTNDDGNIDSTMTSEGIPVVSMHWSRATGEASWEMPDVGVQGTLDGTKGPAMTPDVANGSLYGVWLSTGPSAHRNTASTGCVQGESASCCLGVAPAGCGCSSQFVCCCTNSKCGCSVLGTQCSGTSCA
jgi:hypothetical protein